MTDERPPWEEPQDTPDLPPLVSAADLLPPTEEEIPPPPDESDPPPPGEYVSMFRIERNRFGPGTWGIDICHSDGEMEPVMVFLARVHPDWNGGEVASWLEANGLPQEHAVRLGRQRTGASEGQVAIAGHPAVAKLAAEEEKHYKSKDEFSRAFVQAQTKKERGSKK